MGRAKRSVNDPLINCNDTLNKMVGAAPRLSCALQPSPSSEASTSPRSRLLFYFGNNMQPPAFGIYSPASGPMTPEEFRKHAGELVRLAEKTNDPAAKLSLVSMAFSAFDPNCCQPLASYDLARARFQTFCFDPGNPWG